MNEKLPTKSFRKKSESFLTMSVTLISQFFHLLSTKKRLARK